jgi:methionine biosynthesis protein MetW
MAVDSKSMLSAVLEPFRYDRALKAEDLDPLESDALICEMAPHGARILDIGCGTGALMSLLRKTRSENIVGFEPDPDRAERARSLGLNVTTGYATKKALESLGAFDVIILSDVLEHVAEPASLLQLIKAALAPNGKVVVSVPNVAHWSVRLSLLCGNFDYEPVGIMDATHIWWFTDKSIKKLFETAGYEVQQSKKSLGYWLESYRKGALRRVPNRIKRRLAALGLKWAPNLFGCQHVLSAKIK